MERLIVAMAAILAMMILWLAVLLAGAHAQEEHSGHKPEHMELHRQFYSTWMMPSNRNVSCCHDQDCEPAEAHMINGQWFARKESEAATEDFSPVPDSKIERERDTPDGRSHICGRHYSFQNEGRLTVFCFMPGNGS